MNYEINRPEVPENSYRVAVRAVNQVQKWRAPLSGKMINLTHTIITYDQNGALVTEDQFEVEPRMDDGTIPEHVSVIRECNDCLSIVSASNTINCTCGKTFCLACSKTIYVEDYYPQRLCLKCAKKAQGNFLVRFIKWICK